MRNNFFSVIAFLLMFLNMSAQQNIQGHITINGMQRDYILHLPFGVEKNHPVPLVFIFHGSGSTDWQMQRYMGMDSIADKEHFITVYPQGINKQWNDGRAFSKSVTATDDIKFTDILLDSLEKEEPVDPKRVFATGISNGAFFSLYLSYELNKRFLAIAPVCANIPQGIYDQFSLSQPVSLLLINGTGDPLVPYDGGNVGDRFTGSRGVCVSTAKTIEKFISIDKTTTVPAAQMLPDKNKLDGCQAFEYTYAGGKNDSKVILIKIINGGHTLPGGIQYLPKIIIGKVCRDFNACEMIWDFFKTCPAKN